MVEREEDDGRGQRQRDGRGRVLSTEGEGDWRVARTRRRKGLQRPSAKEKRD